MSSDKGRRGDTRPALVLSLPGFGERSIRLCVPITDYHPQRDEDRLWRVEIGNTLESGLTKMSCADVMQVRALDTSRFKSKEGQAHEAETEASARILAILVGVLAPRENAPTNENG